MNERACSHDPVTAPQVHVIEDDEAFSKNLKHLLDTVQLPSRFYRQFSEFPPESALSGPGCLVLDVRLPGMSGLDILDRMRPRTTHVPVIVITGFADVRTAVRAMKLGAEELFEKPFSPQDFLDATRRCLDLSVRRFAHARRIRDVTRRLATLTPRELEMVELIISGLSTKEIASRLQISAKTAEKHRARMMEKLCARGAAHLAAMVVEARLLDSC